MNFRTRLTAVLSLASLSLSAVNAQDESILSSEYGRQNNQSLLWGPYRPNLYFGVRPRIPESIMAALMWAKVDNYMEVQNGEFVSLSPHYFDPCDFRDAVDYS